MPGAAPEKGLCVIEALRSDENASASDKLSDLHASPALSTPSRASSASRSRMSNDYKLVRFNVLSRDTTWDADWIRVALPLSKPRA